MPVHFDNFHQKHFIMSSVETYVIVPMAKYSQMEDLVMQQKNPSSTPTTSTDNFEKEEKVEVKDENEVLPLNLCARRKPIQGNTGSQRI